MWRRDRVVRSCPPARRTLRMGHADAAAEAPPRAAHRAASCAVAFTRDQSRTAGTDRLSLWHSESDSAGPVLLYASLSSVSVVTPPRCVDASALLGGPVVSALLVRCSGTGRIGRAHQFAQIGDGVFLFQRQRHDR